MKRYLLSLLVFIPFALALVSCDKTNLSGGPLTLEEAIEKTKKDWDQFDLVWAWKDPVPANLQIKIVMGDMGKEYEVSPDFEAWLIFADTNPGQNGGIHYRWYFVDVKTGLIEIVNTSCEPFTDSEWIDKRESKVLLIKNSIVRSKSETKAIPGRASTKSMNSSTNDWAVIINGGVDKYNNAIRYWNDCSWIYQVLRNDYGFIKSHIFPLISDGVNPQDDHCTDGVHFGNSSLDLDNDGVDDVQYSASLYNLGVVFSYLANNVQSGDNVFVYVIDHGGHDGSSSYICLWNTERLYPSTLATWANAINTGARLHFVLGQCNSGGFVSALSGNNRTVTTACGEYESSYAPSYDSYDEFVYHWTNAMAGHNEANNAVVNADNNTDGYVSFEEAFNYAWKNDTYRVLLSETPQYSSTPSLFGAHYDLNGNYSYVPIIQGGDNITSSYSNTYSLSELPSGATASWSVSLGLTNTSIGTGSTKSISNTYSSLPYAGAVLKMTSTYSGAVYMDSKNVSLWVPGNHSNSHLISAYAGEFMLWENIPGITNYSWGTDDPNLTITQQGYFFAPYEMNPGTDPAYEYVWVSFNNPLGELTTIIEQNNAY